MNTINLFNFDKKFIYLKFNFLHRFKAINHYHENAVHDVSKRDPIARTFSIKEMQITISLYMNEISLQCFMELFYTSNNAKTLLYSNRNYCNLFDMVFGSIKVIKFQQFFENVDHFR